LEHLENDPSQHVTGHLRKEGLGGSKKHGITSSIGVSISWKKNAGSHEAVYQGPHPALFGSGERVIELALIRFDEFLPIPVLLRELHHRLIH
jgi:hypothetical protein